MNCKEFHQRLDDALERHQSIDIPELKPHTLECSECRSMWEDCLLLEPQVEVWNQSAAQAVDLVDNVVGQLHAAGLLGQAASSIEPESVSRHSIKATNRTHRHWLVAALSIVCVCVAIVFAFVLNPRDPQIADNDKQHVVPDDLSNGPFNRNHQNIVELNPDDTELALLQQREVDDMVSNAQSGLESLGDSVRQQVTELTELSSIVPSNFDVWDAAENTDQEPDQTGSEPNPWLQRLFDTAEAFDAETT